jgi:hypothetical protein
MTNEQKVIKNKVGLLKLAQTLGASASLAMSGTIAAATASTALRNYITPVAS